MIRLDIPESIADFIEGRVPRRIGTKHYMALTRQADQTYGRASQHLIAPSECILRATFFGSNQPPTNPKPTNQPESSCFIRTRGRLAGPEGFEPSISGFQRRNHGTTAPQASVLIQPRLRAHKNKS